MPPPRVTSSYLFQVLRRASQKQSRPRFVALSSRTFRSSSYCRRHHWSQQQQIDDHPSWCPSCLETGDICHQACDVQLVTTLPQEEELKFDIYPRSAPFSTTMSTEDTPTTSYVVVPRKDYEGLFNKQYAQLTSLQKRVDPDLEREAFFETTLKTHYPKVYQEMIKNDFLLTRPTAIQHVAAAENAAEKNERIQMAMQRQLDQVASGRQRHVKLSNPLYLFTQRYLSQLVRDSSLSPPKR